MVQKGRRGEGIAGREEPVPLSAGGCTVYYRTEEREGGPTAALLFFLSFREKPVSPPSGESVSGRWATSFLPS